MKIQILKIIVFLLIVIGFLACNKKDNITKYYVVGYNAQSGINIENELGKAGQYLIVSENLKDTLATNNLPDDIFVFPTHLFEANICGFAFFPQDYRFTYQLQMTYRPVTKEEEEEAYFICPANLLQLHNVNTKYIVIESISKI